MPLPPVFGESDLGDVGIVTLDAIRAAGGNRGSPQLVFVDLRTGRGPPDSVRSIVATPRRSTPTLIPARVVTLHRVRSLWRVGFGLLALDARRAPRLPLGRHDPRARPRFRHHCARSACARDSSPSHSRLRSRIVTAIILAVGLPIGVARRPLALVGRVTKPIGLLYGGSPLPRYVVDHGAARGCLRRRGARRGSPSSPRVDRRHPPRALTAPCDVSGGRAPGGGVGACRASRRARARARARCRGRGAGRRRGRRRSRSRPTAHEAGVDRER